MLVVRPTELIIGNVDQPLSAQQALASAHQARIVTLMDSDNA